MRWQALCRTHNGEMMVRGVTLAVLAFAVITGTACTDAAKKERDPEPTTIEELDAAVQSAAQTLLDAPGLEVTTRWFDEDGNHVRTDWLDYRSDGTFMLVNQSLSGTLDQMAWIQLANDRFCATSGAGFYCDIEDPKTNEPWARYDQTAVDLNSTQIPISLDLVATATASTADGVPTADLEASRQAGPDGAIVWTVDAPLGETRVTREWTIDAAGFLRSYTAGSDTGLPFGLYSKTQFDFVTVADPSPVDPPTVGTPLDLSALDLPLVD